MIQYSLQLFDMLLHRGTVGIPSEVLSHARDSYQLLLDRKDIVSGADVDDALIAFGKGAWPYWQAEEMMMEQYGKEKEKDAFFEMLPKELHDKWRMYEDSFRHTLVHTDASFDQIFTPEEDVLFEKAVVDAHAYVVDQIRLLIKGEKKDVYEQLVDQYTKEQTTIIDAIARLRALIPLYPVFAEEIEAVARTFELGFAEAEIRPRLEDVQGQIDLYTGKKESFLEESSSGQ